MKYLKKYNENIDWDWVEEENEPILNKFNEVEKKILKNDFPIIVKIHENYHDELVKLVKKHFKSVGLLTEPHIINKYKETGFLYFYIRKIHTTYNLDTDKNKIYNKEKYPNIEIIEII